MELMRSVERNYQDPEEEELMITMCFSVQEFSIFIRRKLVVALQKATEVLVCIKLVIFIQLLK